MRKHDNNNQENSRKDLESILANERENLLKELDDILNNELNEKGRLLVRAKRIEREFAQTLIEIRKDKGLTQSDIAKKTGLTQQAVSKLEQCNRMPTLPNLIRYLLGLDIDLNEVFRQHTC